MPAYALCLQLNHHMILSDACKVARQFFAFIFPLRFYWNWFLSIMRMMNEICICTNQLWRQMVLRHIFSSIDATVCVTLITAGFSSNHIEMNRAVFRLWILKLKWRIKCILHPHKHTHIYSRYPFNFFYFPKVALPEIETDKNSKQQKLLCKLYMHSI